MIKSMTGYGRARETRNKRDITVEVRSVNNRYLDCTVKMPRMYAFAEDAVKKHVQQAVVRERDLVTNNEGLATPVLGQESFKWLQVSRKLLLILVLALLQDMAILPGNASE